MIIAIVAIDRNGAIGKDGKLPWHYSSDMKFFKETTTGHACVMGHKTWLTLKQPLPNRLNIVLSRNAELQPSDSVVVARDVESVLRMSEDLSGDLFVIGGEQVYRAFLPYIERWIVTEVPLSVDAADAFVPNGFLNGFALDETRKLDEELLAKFYSKKSQ